MTTSNENQTETALTTRQEKMLAIRDDMAPGARPLAIVPRTFAEAQAMCLAIAKAGVIPTAYRNKPEDMIVVVMSGAEIGLPPMQSLALYHLIQGLPRLSAKGITAVVLAHPSCEYLEPRSASETAATWIGKRRGRPEKSVTWTIERAKRAGILDANPMWKKYPEEMLNARASSQLCRLVWPDVAAGLISAEEQRDGDFIADAEYTEAPSRGFVALPMSAPAVVAAGSADAPAATPTTSGRAAKPPKPDKAKPVEAQATERPTSPPSSSGSTSDGAKSAASTSAPASGDGTPSKFDAAKAKVEAKRDPAPAPVTVDRWGQEIAVDDPTEATSGGSSSPSASSQDSSPTETDPGAFDVWGDEPEPPTPEPAPPPVDPFERPRATLREAGWYAWLSGCKTQAELSVGKDRKWKPWSLERAKGGDTDFVKRTPAMPDAGAGVEEMQNSFSVRKSELPA